MPSTKRFITGFLVVAVTLLSITFYMWNYYRVNVSRIEESAGSMQEYSRHFLFVCDDTSEMWRSIYNYALSYAHEHDAALEWVGRESPVRYSLTECMNIGISSKADGIILVPDGTEEIEEAIRRATEAQIPVVDLMRDVPDSGRISFIGASNSQLGEQYGEQILRLLKEGENRVCLLTDAANSQAVSNLLYSQIVSALKSRDEKSSSVDLYTKEVDSRNDFEAEERIREILMDEEKPDILICVNSVQTECAETALVEYNLVEEVQVIGYYASENILAALRRDLLPAAITCDAQQVGELSVTALHEYLNNGHVSDYFDISLVAVTTENVNRYVRNKYQAYSGREGIGG